MVLIPIHYRFLVNMLVALLMFPSIAFAASKSLPHHLTNTQTLGSFYYLTFVNAYIVPTITCILVLVFLLPSDTKHIHVWTKSDI